MYAVYAVTYGALIFSVPGLPGGEHKPDGIVLWLLGNISGEVGILLVSALPCALAGGTLEMVPIFHAMFADIASRLQGAPPEEIMGTVLVTSFITTGGLGVFFVLVAKFGVAKHLRAVPLVVLKGALFGVAIFMWQSAFHITVPVAEQEPSWHTYIGVMQENWTLWASALLAGIVLFLVDEHVHSIVAIPSLFMLIACFPAALHYSGLATFDTLRSQGWLFPDVSKGGAPTTWYGHMGHAYLNSVPVWPVVARQVPGMLGIWVTHALCSLMDMKATEMISGVEAHLPTEIMAIGVSNILSACSGASWPVYMNCSTNISAWKLKGTRITAVMTALGQVVLLFKAQDVVPCLPRLLPGGASFWLGLLFAKETLGDIMQQHAKKYDIFMVLFMAVMMFLVGFVDALLVGLLVAMGIFTMQYSSSPVVIRAAGSAQFFRSNSARTKKEEAFLQSHCHRIWVIHADGLIMFGSSPHLADEVKSALERGADSVLLNCRGVQGLDYSGALDLMALGRRAAALSRRVVLTELREEVLQTLRSAGARLQQRGGAGGAAGGGATALVGLCYEDHYHAALRLCEDALLGELCPQVAGGPDGLSLLVYSGNSCLQVAELLRLNFGEQLPEAADGEADGALAALQRCFELETFEPGSILWREGDSARCCVGVLEGEVWGLQAAACGTRSRLMEVVLPGSFTGYTSLFPGERYLQTAQASPGGRVTVAKLTREAFAELEERRPRLALAFLRIFLRTGVSELSNLTRFMTST